jgi:hypothetical protein
VGKKKHNAVCSLPTIYAKLHPKPPTVGTNGSVSKRKDNLATKSLSRSVLGDFPLSFQKEVCAHFGGGPAIK